MITNSNHSFKAGCHCKTSPKCLLSYLLETIWTNNQLKWEDIQQVQLNKLQKRKFQKYIKEKTNFTQGLPSIVQFWHQALQRRQSQCLCVQWQFSEPSGSVPVHMLLIIGRQN
jgi:hypothetical protein